ncbi:MAG: hypothetical protein ACPGXK_17015 [Phycisphaerae bacterium]
MITTCKMMACPILAMCLLLAACEKQTEQPQPTTVTSSDPTPAVEQPPLEFPDELQAEEPEVNAILTKAMTLCTTGDYEAFREIWSARETPLSEAKFRHMREAVTQISIGALEKAAIKRTDEKGMVVPEIVYVAYARMGLDVDRLPPRAAEKYKDPETGLAPEREAVLMLVREFDEWRLAHAPDEMRRWLKNKVNPQPDAENG